MAGTRATKQSRNRPSGRASAIQPLGATRYAATNLAISSASAALSAPKTYVARPSACAAIPADLAQTCKQPACTTSTSSIDSFSRAASALPPSHPTQIVNLTIGPQ